jgi:hypothetical protein
MKLEFQDLDSLLIWLFVFIDDMFAQTELPLYTERFSNNKVQFFSDNELFTISIFTHMIGYHKKIDGYKYIKHHYAQWFPDLPTYSIYSRKLNKFHEALTYIYKIILKRYFPLNIKDTVIDTMPVIICQQQHSSKASVAKPIATKGYCAAKNIYYHGIKLQIIGNLVNKKLPIPIDYEIESAHIHDLTIAKQSISDYNNINIYADLGYCDHSYRIDLFENNHVNLITPYKRKKNGNPLTLFRKAYNTLHAKMRQPIENLFAWINEKTHINIANKVRSIDGLFYHIHVKMVTALLLMIVKF